MSPFFLRQGVKDFTAQGAPTDGRRRLYQTSESPIPHPDTSSLKKSATASRLRDRFIVYNPGRPTHSATPQIPLQEEGVKKSSTAGRPVDRKRSGLIIDSIESILNFKTHPNIDKTGVTTEGSFLVSRVLDDRDKMKLYGKGTPLSKKLEIPTYNYEAEVFRRLQTPLDPGIVRIPSDNSDGDLLATESAVFRRDEISPIPRPKFKGSDEDSLAPEAEVFRRGQVSIPHPPPEGTGGDSLGNKRTLVFSDDTSKILKRKTLLYSEPLYRPTDSASDRNVRIDPRRLISILGDPWPYKRSGIAGKPDNSHASKRVRIIDGPWWNMHRKGRTRGTHHRKARFRHHRAEALALNRENWDRDKQEFAKASVGLPF